MSDVNGAPPTATSTRRADWFGVTVTPPPAGAPIAAATVDITARMTIALGITALENKSQRDLHHSRRPGGNHLAEPRVHLVAGAIEPRRRVHRGELRGVEDVIDLPAKLQPSGATERDVLEHRDVGVGDARAADDIL